MIYHLFIKLTIITIILPIGYIIGGVLIYVKCNLKIKILNKLSKNYHKINNYNHYFTNRLYNRRRCFNLCQIYFKIKILNKLYFSNNILDCITLELCIEKNTNIIISAIYRATRYTNEAISEFNNIMLKNCNPFNNTN